MSTLTVTPQPAAPSTVVAVAGSGFPYMRTRLLLDGVGATTNVFRPRKDGTFTVGITVGTNATETLVAQQLANSIWKEAAQATISVAVAVDPPPTPPPPLVISAIVVTMTTSGATITWHVSEGAQGWVEYGLSTTYGSETTHETSFTYTDHSQTITGLALGATYHYRIHAVNAAGAQATSPDGTFTTTTVVVPPSTGTYPPITTLRSVTRPPIPPLEPIRQGIIDATWGTRITRVGEAGEHNTYSNRPAWNCDGSLLLLDYPPNATRVMLDGHDYHLLQRSPTTRQFWSNVDPNLLWGAEGSTNAFSAVDWRTGVNAKRFVFSGYSSVSLGDYEGNMPNDDARTVLQTSGPTGMILINTTTGSILAAKTFTARPNSVRMSQSGQYVIANFGTMGTGTEQGTQVYDLNLTRLRQINTYGNHNDVGMLNGRDVWVGVARNSAGGAVMVYLDNGTVVPLRSDNWPGGSAHVSCRNIKQPGWAYFSGDTYGQIVAMNLANPAQVRVYGFDWDDGTPPYDQSQFACPSPDGTRVTYGSIRSGQVYGYVAEAA